MSEQWNPMDRVKPSPGQRCEVIYADGIQDIVKFAGGQIFTDSKGLYRYVNVTMWRPAKTGVTQ